MTQRVVDGDTWNYSYDQEGRLTGVSGPVTASYTYDAEGRLAKGVVGNDTTYYANELYEVKNGNYTRYYWFDERRIALRTSAGVSWLYPDHLGSTMATAGTAASDGRYTPWGMPRDASETVVTDYRYTGQREEPELDMYYYGARWYDPSIGRFMQPDSIVPEPGNPQSLNRYSYVLNNPMRYTDPSGMFTEDELLQYGISHDDIGLWKQDAQWWEFIKAAQLFDFTRLANSSSKWLRFSLSLSNEIYGNPQLILKENNGDWTTSLGNYRAAAVHWGLSPELYRPACFGHTCVAGQQVSLPTAYIRAGIPTKQLAFDVHRVDWGDVTLDIAGLATFGMSKAFKAIPAISKAAALVGDTISGVQAGKSLSDVVNDVGGPWAFVSAGASVASIYPPVSLAVSLVGLGASLGPGVYLRDTIQ